MLVQMFLWCLWILTLLLYEYVPWMIYNNIPVVTNDNFRDHIYEMFELFDTKNNKIKNYISEMKLSFSDKYIEDKIGYSKCIQVINNSIYIPTETGYYRMSY